MITAKDSVFGATDRESYEDLTKALQTDDKPAQAQLLVHGKLVELRPGTKLKVVASYDYMGTHAYKAQMTEDIGEGPDETLRFSVFVNARYVDAMK